MCVLVWFLGDLVIARVHLVMLQAVRNSSVATNCSGLCMPQGAPLPAIWDRPIPD